PSLVARLPSLHAKNEDAPGKGPSQDLKNAEVPLPRNLSPQLHSALKKYGRVVSAHALALREYALHLLHQGVSVDEVVKTLHSVLKDKTFFDGKEYSASLQALVRKLEGALKYTSAEGNTFPRLNSAVPARFLIPGALRYDAVSKEGDTIPVAVPADISPYVAEEVSLSSGAPLIASESLHLAKESTPNLSRVILTDRDVPPASTGVREESHETSGPLTQEDVPFVQHEQLNLSLSSAVIEGKKHSIQPGPSLDFARAQQVDLSFSPFHRITEHITRFMESRQAKTIQIQLEPPELGSVLLSVYAVGNRIDAEILAINPDVRHYLETHREQIAAALQSRGLELASFTVSDHGRQGGLFDSIPSRVGSWSAPIPINETPRLSSSALLLTTGLDLKA
ncbi:MAG: flagellar hook-length control protein FliK, partial [Candidatus Caldarchaeum sp.]